MTAPEKLSAFVLMPFEAHFDDLYRFGIKAAVEELDMEATRVDEQVFHTEGILERIYNQIDAAAFIIADMSGKNENVFYEVGYAHAKQKTCILLTKEARDIPFDLKHRRHIIYKSISDLKQKLTTDLAQVKAELEADQIRITSPLDGQLLDRQSIHKGISYVVRGTLRTLPTEHRIWLLNVNENFDKVWCQISRVKYPFPRQGEWEGSTYFSEGQKSAIIVAVVAPETSQDLFTFYQHALGERRKELPLRSLTRIPVEIKNFAQVHVRAPGNSTG
jgi:nucleoside 2-deoxyribosyltransferase